LFDQNEKNKTAQHSTLALVVALATAWQCDIMTTNRTKGREKGYGKR